MTTFTLTIDMSKFETDGGIAEIQDILTKLATSFNWSPVVNSGDVRDSLGNVVGDWEILMVNDDATLGHNLLAVLNERVAVLDAEWREWREAFDALRAAGLEADADDPIAARYRAASDAVNHANRSREAVRP